MDEQMQSVIPEPTVGVFEQPGAQAPSSRSFGERSPYDLPHALLWGPPESPSAGMSAPSLRLQTW